MLENRLVHTYIQATHRVQYSTEFIAEVIAVSIVTLADVFSLYHTGILFGLSLFVTSATSLRDVTQ